MSDDVEKSEQPTPKRRKEARKQGQLAISQEMFTVANLVAVTGILLFLGGTAAREGMLLFRTAWEIPEVFGPSVAADKLRQAFGAAGRFLIPVLGATVLAALIAGFGMTKGNIATARLKPKLSKLSPAKNFSKVIKKDAPIQLAKSILKLVIVGGVVGTVVVNHIDEYSNLWRLPLYHVIGFQLGTILRAFLAGCAALFILAILDYLHEYWRMEKQLKMSRMEVKDESKQSEGDPQVKARIRGIQMEKARLRMMAKVPEADVIVTNPDHVSVALAYRREEMFSPKVLAKGRGILALRIQEIGRESGVPIVRNPLLARTLYRSVKVGKSIPEKLYQAVAELLAYVYRLDRERARAW